MRRFHNISIILAALAVFSMSALSLGFSVASNNHTPDLSGILERLDDLEKDPPTPPQAPDTPPQIDPMPPCDCEPIDLPPSCNCTPQDPTPPCECEPIPEQQAPEPLSLVFPFTHDFEIVTDYSANEPILVLEFIDFDMELGTPLFTMHDCVVEISTELPSKIMLIFYLTDHLQARLAVPTSIWGDIDLMFSDQDVVSAGEQIATIRYPTIFLWFIDTSDGVRFVNPHDYLDFDSG